MKSLVSTLSCVVLVAASFVFAGCGGSSKTKMDTAEFTKAFASADAAFKAPADEAVKALTEGKLLEGANALVKVAKAGQGKLSEPQKNALINLGSTVQMIMSEDGDKADLKIYQAVEDLMAILNESEPSKVGTTPDRVVPGR